MKARNVALVILVVACAVYLALDQSETWIMAHFAHPAIGTTAAANSTDTPATPNAPEFDANADSVRAPHALNDTDVAVMNPYDLTAGPDGSAKTQNSQTYFAPVIAATQPRTHGALRFSFDTNPNLLRQNHASKEWADIVIPEDKDDFHVDAYVPKKETPAPRRKLVRRASVLEDNLQIMEGHAEDQFANL